VKRVWVRVKGWQKPLVTAALESGADGLVLDEGISARAKELGRLTTIAPDGDLKLGEDVLHVQISSKEDEQKAAEIPDDKRLIVGLADWRIIPLENLIARRSRPGSQTGLMVEVASAEEARTAVQTLEKGADGVVTVCDDPAEVRRIVEMIHAVSEPVRLAVAEVTEIRPLGMGDRVCVDTCSNMLPGEGMLVGNTSEGFLLVHSESLENPYVEARPFRVNAGAVHAYVLGPKGETRYLSELRAGDEVLLVDHQGRTRLAYVGRSKVERRPLLLVRAKTGDQEVGLVLQNAETIRLTAPDGRAVSVATLKKGDAVLAHTAQGGRHFGMKVEETVTEK
jgi:3-dehydroquinate synthase II